MKARHFSHVVAALCIGLGVQWAHAAPFAPSAQELAVLPPFCKAKLSADPSDDAAYSGSIGPDWLHIHHYCFGLNFANRFYRDYGNRVAQADDLKEAINNYDYVLEHATPDFWMRAEVGTQKARLQVAARDNVNAVATLGVALKANAAYAPAYAVLSDIYRDSGQKAKALASVEQGLQNAPLDKPLQRRYKNLSGKAFVVPAGAEAKVAKPAAEAAAKSDAAPANAAIKPAADATSTPDKIGVPGNPYCRFCP
jgi:tetratricopeptide (TPR) repeat protein